MTAADPVLANWPADRCGRCGSVLSSTGGTPTCQECLLADLRAETLAEWFAPPGETTLTGLKAAGGFTLLEEIGHGGMGQVYRARQHSPDREVAVKVLMPHLSGSEETRRRFLAESAAMAGMDHPGLLPLYACGETDGRPWLATRLANGGNLSQRRGSYAGQWRAIAELTAGLAEAIQHAHSRGIIHRDLKPSNILFDAAGAASVADFGLAKWRDETTAGQTLSHAVMGTPAYMAPELAVHGSRGATTAADVYGLGAILYELLTGQAPHLGTTPVEVLHRVTSCEPLSPRSLRPDIPRDLAVICQKAISRNAGDRYATAAALATDLNRYLNNYPVTARPYALTERALRWTRRHPLAAGLMGALLTVMAVSAFYILRQNAALREAEAGWRKAADQADARAAYAIETLPAKLAPLGRLHDLDELFADVASHYAHSINVPSSHPDGSKRREAHFRLQWGSVLHQQGRIPEALDNLNRAVHLYSYLTLQPEAVARDWVLMAQARQWLALNALRQDHQSEASQQLLMAENAVRQGLENFPDHPDLLIARAEILAERLDFQLTGNKPDSFALDLLETAWREAAAANVSNGADKQNYCARESATIHFYRGEQARNLGHWPEAERHFRDLLTERERLGGMPWATAEDRCQIAISSNLVVRAMIGNGTETLNPEREAEISRLVKQQRNLMDSLITSDPSNLHWKAEAALMLFQEAGLAMRKDFATGLPLLQKASGLIQSIPDEVTRNLKKGRINILSALVFQMALQAGKLSLAATELSSTPGAGKARKEAIEAAGLAFETARGAMPALDSSLLREIVRVCSGIWEKHAPSGYARQQLGKALAEAPAGSPWQSLLASQLKTLDSHPPPPGPNPEPAPSSPP